MKTEGFKVLFSDEFNKVLCPNILKQDEYKVKLVSNMIVSSSLQTTRFFTASESGLHKIYCPTEIQDDESYSIIEHPTAGTLCLVYTLNRDFSVCIRFYRIGERKHFCGFTFKILGLGNDPVIRRIEFYDDLMVYFFEGKDGQCIAFEVLEYKEGQIELKSIEDLLHVPKEHDFDFWSFKSFNSKIHIWRPDYYDHVDYPEKASDNFIFVDSIFGKSQKTYKGFGACIGSNVQNNLLYFAATVDCEEDSRDADAIFVLRSKKHPFEDCELEIIIENDIGEQLWIFGFDGKYLIYTQLGHDILVAHACMPKYSKGPRTAYLKFSEVFTDIASFSTPPKTWIDDASFIKFTESYLNNKLLLLTEKNDSRYTRLLLLKRESSATKAIALMLLARKAGIHPFSSVPIDIMKIIYDYLVGIPDVHIARKRKREEEWGTASLDSSSESDSSEEESDSLDEESDSSDEGWSSESSE